MDKPKNSVPNVETDQVARALLVWLNSWPGKPVDLINFEFLQDDAECMTMSEIQGAYKTKQYIDGSYEAQYQFKVIYRSASLNSLDKRLKAIEMLNAFADWMGNAETTPMLGAGRIFKEIKTNSRASLFGRYADGTEDIQVLMTMNYEVINNG